MTKLSFTRRGALAGLGSLLGAGAAARLAGVPLPGVDAAAPAAAAGHAHAARATNRGSDHAGFARGGRVDPATNGFDPTGILRDFDAGKTTRLASGRVLREWELVAIDKEIEVAPGVKFAAWTYNGRVPGPTLRCREGERVRVRFTNAGAHPHTIHFHGFHPAFHDGIPGVGGHHGGGLIETGKTFTYEFDAEPFGFHHYHCHTSLLRKHIEKGLYGAFIIDPREGRTEADEMVMVMNGFDTNFDASNEVYAVNTVAFHYQKNPIQIKKGELVRIYVVNVLEFDFINSFHTHANFFDYYPTGTKLEPSEFTDTKVFGQGERGIMEFRYNFPGRFMFHAHVSEFAELGWMGLFDVVEE